MAAPLLSAHPEVCAELIHALKVFLPCQIGFNGALWTIPKIIRLIALYGLTVRKSALWALLKMTGFSWKRTRKLLLKADTGKRREFVVKFAQVYDEMRLGKRLLVYVDEAHFRLDSEDAHGWFVKGVPAHAPSNSKQFMKVNFYGAYDFTNGAAMAWSSDSFCAANTAEFLRQIRDWLKSRRLPVTVIMDNAPAHRGVEARLSAAGIKLDILRLPAYSPDLNAIEGLWKWMRAEVKKNACHETTRALFDACLEFVNRINRDPDALIKRLWPKFELDEDEERLRMEWAALSR